MLTQYAYRLETRRFREKDFKYKAKPFSSPDSVRAFLRVLDSFDNEQFIAILVDSKNKLIGIFRQSGTVDQTTVYVREVAKHALLSGAVGVIIAHNHPSGNTTPSGADKNITAVIKKGLGLLDIKLHDHFIVGADGDLFSFSEAGLM